MEGSKLQYLHRESATARDVIFSTRPTNIYASL